MWDLLSKHAEVCDRNSLTADDFIVSIGKQRYDPELMKPYTIMVQNLHDMLDLIRDGFLQEDEWQRILVQTGFPDPSFVKETFKAIDVNGDGKLSIDEFTNAFFDFLFSDDEQSPNRFFFGPLDD